jgi:DNA-binding LacI/PurR family transcriptional regulator/DNA-binding transcriptional regulator YhcF (GntR family)
MKKKNSTVRTLQSPSTQQTIAEELLSRLGTQWHVGDRLPPVKELASMLGAGASNTYFAVRQLAQEGLLHCQQKRGTFVIGLPTKPAGSSAQSGKHEASLAGKRIKIYQHAQLLDGFTQRTIRAFKEGFTGTSAQLETCVMPDSPRQFQEDDSHALVLFNPSTDQQFNVRPGQHVLVVTIASQHLPRLGSTSDMVTVDEHQGSILAGQAFAGVAARDVCFIGRRVARGIHRLDAISAVRLHGFEAGLNQLIAPENIIIIHGYSPASGVKAFLAYSMLPHRPRYIFAASDDLAIGFIAAATAHGLKPVLDYQIIGFDGQDRGQKLDEGSLTTIKVPTTEMGSRAARLLIEKFQHPSSHTHRLLLGCSFKQGTTTAAR